MNCKNCGANFKTTELRCPYCGSFNVVAEELDREKKWYEKIFFNAREEFKQRGIWMTLDKIVNRVLLITGALFFLMMFLMWSFYMLEGVWEKATYERNRQTYIETMEEYHEAEDWYGLYQYMNEKKIPGKEFYGYQQAGLLASHYKDYMMYKVRFLDLSEQEKMEDDYYLKYAFRYSYEVYSLDMGIYDALDPMNEKHFGEYQNEILCFWKYTLGLTEEEIQEIIAWDSFPYSEELDALLEDIKSREAWQNDRANES